MQEYRFDNHKDLERIEATARCTTCPEHGSTPDVEEVQEGGEFILKLKFCCEKLDRKVYWKFF